MLVVPCVVDVVEWSFGWTTLSTTCLTLSMMIDVLEKFESCACCAVVVVVVVAEVADERVVWMCRLVVLIFFKTTKLLNHIIP